MHKHKLGQKIEREDNVKYRKKKEKVHHKPTELEKEFKKKFEDLTHREMFIVLKNFLDNILNEETKI